MEGGECSGTYLWDQAMKWDRLFSDRKSLERRRGSPYTSDVFYFLLLLAWRLCYILRDGVLTYFW